MKISDAKTLLGQIMVYNWSQAEAGKDHNTFLVPFFSGDPGVGKTQIPKQVAQENNVPYFQTIVAQYDAGEMAGLPFRGTVAVRDVNFFSTEREAVRYATENHLLDAKVVKNEEDGEYYVIHKEERMIRMRPSYLPNPHDQDGSVCVYNLDELPQAFLANQNICSQLVNEWRVGEHRIAPGVTICATGNKPENKAGTTTMPTHLRDRLMFIPIEVDQGDWLHYAATHGVDYRIRAYIGENASRLHKFTVGANANPTPRSWEKASAILSLDLPKHVRKQALDGQIGEGEAVAFEAWIRVEDKMPKVAEIIANPDTAPTFGNSDAAVLYLLLANLADVTNEKNVEAILKYLVRLPNKEFMAVYAKDAFPKHPELKTNKFVTRFKAEHLGKTLF